MIDILIPTCRPYEAIAEMVNSLTEHASQPVRVHSSCLKASAAANRNWCLAELRSIGDAAIMLDDDIDGFYANWDDDLISALNGERVVAVSARLMRPDGRVGDTCSRCYDLSPDEIDIKPSRECVMPTAAIAFINYGIRFDENFRGSGFEDGDWFFQYRQMFPECRFIQSNKCRLVHRNEMKHQREHWRHNKEYFESKWKRQPIST